MVWYGVWYGMVGYGIEYGVWYGTIPYRTRRVCGWEATDTGVCQSISGLRKAYKLKNTLEKVQCILCTIRSVKSSTVRVGSTSANIREIEIIVKKK